jgi:hypothetical protein
MMAECDLSNPVSSWLESMGFTPYAEVPFPQSNHPIDLVGRNGQEIITVELKVSLTKKLVHQAYMCDLITDRRYAAVSTKPKAKGISECERHGIGLLSVVDGKVNVILEPQEKFPATAWVRCKYATAIHKNLDVMTPNGIGGVPCMKGVGPAQECFDRVQAYRAEHPNAKWSEIYRAVQNHYVSPGSLCGAMRTVEKNRKLSRVPAT